MSHANALLTPRTRLRLARLVVEDGWPYTTAGKYFHIKVRTSRKWAQRYRAEARSRDAGPVFPSTHHAYQEQPCDDSADRSPTVAQTSRAGPDCRPSRYPSLDRACVAGAMPDQPVARIDRATGEPLRRYEHLYPGSLIHVDVTKFGNIPDGGDWRFTGRAQGKKNRVTTSHRTGGTQ